MFNNMNEVYDYLFNQRNHRKTNERIKLATKMLNLNPNYPIIHIAGTNGKGSTGILLKSILELTGNHIGFFTSPYVVSFNERIQINDRYISNAEIMHYMNFLYEFNTNFEKEYNENLTFFELTLLMALMFFRDRNIDAAIFECGIGGMEDATNILDTKFSIITNVGFDHMAMLGDNLRDIACQKLGIIRPNHPCITCVHDELKPLFSDYANDRNSKMIFVRENVSNIKLNEDSTEFDYKGEHYKTSLLGEVQAYNAATAIEAAKFFDSSFPKSLIDFGLTHVTWPGRFEIIRKEPEIILDGAHNLPGVEELIKTLKVFKKNKKLTIVFSALKDKDYSKMIDRLNEVADMFYFVSTDDERSMDKSLYKDCTNHHYLMFNKLVDVINHIYDNQKENEIVLFTGSLHFISEVRQFYK